MNLIVIANQASSNSCEIANYYAEQRKIPPQNIVRINWTGGNLSWSVNDLTNVLLTPLLQAITNRNLTDQIHGVVLSMDIPFQTVDSANVINSTTAAIFYGFRNDFGSASNLFARCELDFENFSKTSVSGGKPFLCTMLTGNSKDDVKSMIDRGVSSDQSNPQQPFFLVKTSDPTRNLRYPTFDNVLLDTRILGGISGAVTNTDTVSGLTNLFGCSIGLGRWDLAPNTFTPGAIADSLTSFGGIIFGPNDQTNLLSFLRGGAAGSYGTVAEPFSDPLKFPDAQVYFYQGRGFNLAESYYQSIVVPCLGLIVGEPLAAPFKACGVGTWRETNTTIFKSGTIILKPSFSAADNSRPLQKINLFVDGSFNRTVTNVSPTPGDVLTLNINGCPVSQAVPPNSSAESIASNLCVAVNNSVTLGPLIRAIPHGDRVELQAIDTNLAAFPFFAGTQSTVSGNFYRASYLSATSGSRLSAPLKTKDGFHVHLDLPAPSHHTVEASTNLTNWIPVFTNYSSGAIDFIDANASNFAHRFYRLASATNANIPKISLLNKTLGTVSLQLESLPGQPCILFSSTNGTAWTPMITNGAGGIFDFLDATINSTEQKFYRTAIPQPALPVVSLANGISNLVLVKIDGAQQPFVVETSTNAVEWQPLTTNYLFREIQVASTISSTGSITTYLTPSLPTFLPSWVCGYQDYTFFSGTLTVGAWAEFTISKTNGQSIVIGATNQLAGVNATNLALQIFNQINARPELQNDAGVVADDLSILGGQTKFSIRARRAGYGAAQIGVTTARSSFSTGVSIAPSTYKKLTKNVSDIVPRNHFYVSIGTSTLAAEIPLDTTLLEDGYHELTAVAYEGTSVRTQTQITNIICISNSPLAAILSSTNLTNNAPVQGLYQIRISANTNNVSRTTLFSTGRVLGTVSNTPLANFTVAGTNLWAGLHPFYAIVETHSGQRYRTATTWIRLK